MFDTIAADIDAPKGEKDIFAFAESRRIDKTSVVPEALGTEEVELDPEAKAEVKFCRWPNSTTATERRTGAEVPIPKDIWHRFEIRKRRSRGGKAVESEGVMVSDPAGIKDPNAETGAGAGDVSKTELDDELVPSMTDGGGLMPKIVHKSFSCAWF
jgi:hypothetical protein